MIYRMYDVEIGMKIDGVTYSYTDVVSLTVEDPLFNRLTRGANGKNREGIPYQEGVREPKRWTVIIQNMTQAVKNLLEERFQSVGRVDVFAIASDGSAKMLKTAILCQAPRQTTLDDTPDSMNVTLIFEGYEDTEDHKS